MQRKIKPKIIIFFFLILFFVVVQPYLNLNKKIRNLESAEITYHIYLYEKNASGNIVKMQINQGDMLAQKVADCFNKKRLFWVRCPRWLVFERVPCIEIHSINDDFSIDVFHNEIRFFPKNKLFFLRRNIDDSLFKKIRSILKEEWEKKNNKNCSTGSSSNE